MATGYYLYIASNGSLTDVLGLSNVEDIPSHVWVTAIDTYIAEDGLDPSYPAYWMVQQEVGTSNHAPWWSLY